MFLEMFSWNRGVLGGGLRNLFILTVILKAPGSYIPPISRTSLCCTPRLFQIPGSWIPGYMSDNVVVFADVG